MKIVCLVHPGSACGSADFNIGRNEAQTARDDLSNELEMWDGGVIVIDGYLSDELPAFPKFNRSIMSALERAKGKGQIAMRLQGEDPAQVECIHAFITADPVRKAWAYTVGGAWLYPNGEGCVGSVVDTLRKLGCTAHPSAFALNEDA
jgi:hypothetical protein